SVNRRQDAVFRWLQNTGVQTELISRSDPSTIDAKGADGPEQLEIQVLVAVSRNGKFSPPTMLRAVRQRSAALHHVLEHGRRARRRRSVGAGGCFVPKTRRGG